MEEDHYITLLCSLLDLWDHLMVVIRNAITKLQMDKGWHPFFPKRCKLRLIKLLNGP